MLSSSSSLLNFVKLPFSSAIMFVISEYDEVNDTFILLSDKSIFSIFLFYKFLLPAAPYITAKLANITCIK